MVIPMNTILRALRRLLPGRRAGARGAALLLTAASLLPTVIPRAAFAHAFLVRAIPAVGATVDAAPSRLTLVYTEGVVPHFCRVQVTGPGGAAVPVGPPRTEPGHRRVLLVTLPQLAPGHYTVTWHAVSIDTHRTEGRFGFTIAARAP